MPRLLHAKHVARCLELPAVRCLAFHVIYHDQYIDDRFSRKSRNRRGTDVLDHSCGTAQSRRDASAFFFITSRPGLIVF